MYWIPKILFDENFLRKTALITVCIMCFSFPFSFALFNVGLVTLIVVFCLRLIRERRWVSYSVPLEIATALFFVLSLFSIMNSQHLLMSLEGTQKILRYLLCFLVSLHVIKSRRDARSVVIALLAGGILAAVNGLLQHVLGTDPLRGRTPSVGLGNLIRISSSFPTPNAFVVYLSFLVPFAYVTARYNKRLKLLSMGALILLSLACLFTFSRTAIFAIIFGIFLVTVLKKEWKSLLVVILAVGIGAFFLPEQIANWFTSLDSWKNFFVDSSRQLHHAAAWNMFKAHPFLGVGINTFDVNYINYREIGDPVTRWSAHHAYLQMLAETGLVGFMSFIALFVITFRQIIKAYSRMGDMFIKTSLLSFIAAISSFLITGFFESVLWQPRQTYFFWFLFGIGFSFTRILDPEELSKK